MTDTVVAMTWADPVRVPTSTPTGRRCGPIPTKIDTGLKGNALRRWSTRGNARGEIEHIQVAMPAGLVCRHAIWATESLRGISLHTAVAPNRSTAEIQETPSGVALGLMRATGRLWSISDHTLTMRHPVLPIHLVHQAFKRHRRSGTHRRRSLHLLQAPPAPHP